MSESYFALTEPLARIKDIPDAPDWLKSPDWLVTAPFVNGFQIIVALLILSVIIVVCILLHNTSTAPADLTGGWGRDYNALQSTRKSLVDFPGFDLTTPMINFGVLTANFGGIFTENPSALSPWSGVVSANAATLQVEAGARALVLDIWPNPTDRTQPIVCAMMDLMQRWAQKWWLNNGLNKSVKRYSNWNAVTRNMVPAGDIINAAINAAFASPSGLQNGDPFFLILKLHGAMTPAYLNKLGDIVNAAINPTGTNTNGYAMNSGYSSCKNQNKMNTAPVNDFMNKACVIAIPDIQTEYDILPDGNNTYVKFTKAFLGTTLGEATNYLEQGPQTVFFEPDGISKISADQLNANGFCVVQPSIGGEYTNNDYLFTTDYQTCVKSGAQFVAVNLFSPSNLSGSGDSNATLSLAFDPAYFGTYSFRKT